MISFTFLESIYNIIYISIYIAYFTALINIQIFSEDYRDNITPYISLFTSLFLIVRFNPFVYNEYTQFDRRIVFDTAVFLLLSTLITNGYLLYATEFQKKFI